MLQAIILPLITIISLINFFGGIVGGIWLLFKGEWALVIWALVFFFAGGTFLITILLLPTMGLGFLSTFLIEKKKYIGIGIISTISNIYTILIMALWGLAFMFFFLSKSHYEILTPTILLSYGPATSPWAYMASKDQGFSISHIATFFLQVAYLATGAVIIFGNNETYIPILGTYLGIMGFGLIVIVIYSWFFLGGVAESEINENNAY